MTKLPHLQIGMWDPACHLPVTLNSSHTRLGPKEITMKLERLADYACKCGENPLWNPVDGRMYWSDIETGRLFWYDPKTKKHEQFYWGLRVGGFTFQPDGSLLCFRDKGNIAIVNTAGKVTRTLVESIPSEKHGRFNDVIADPEGRVFCGTLMENGTKGRLFRLDRNGKLTKVVDGVGCSNGMGFTPDLKQMYFTDSMAFTIDLFDYNRKTGALTNRRPWVKGKKADGYPDGMTVDAKGNVWSTRWGGSCVIKYNPAGKEIGRIKFPTKLVSSCVFGGKDYKDLYLTTAGGDRKHVNGEPAGSLYRVKPGAKGVPEYFSRIK